MATKKKTTTTTTVAKTRKRKLMERAGIAALKGMGSASLGATVGVVEEAVGPRAAKGTQAGMALIGFATEIFVDPLENPVISEAGKASLHSAAAVTGYKAGKATTRKALDAKHERDHAQMRERLRQDMAPTDTTTTEEPEKANEESKVAPRAAKKRTQKLGVQNGDA